MAKALEQVEAGKAPTQEQAFSKFYESRDPEIRELIKRGKVEGSI